MNRISWLPPILLTLGIVLSLLLRDILWLLPFAGGALGIFFWEIAYRKSSRQAAPLEEALDVLERFTTQGMGETRWYVDPGKGLDRLSTRMNALLDDLAASGRTMRFDRERLEALLLALDAGVVVVGEDDRVVLVSHAASSLLRTTPAAARGRPLLGFDGMLPVEDIVRASRTDGTSRTVDAAFPDGRTVEARVTPILGRREVLIVLRDKSEIRRLEVEGAEILQNLSHEIRTPLTSIRGFAETLLDPTVPEADRGRFLKTILRESDRVSALVDDLSDLTASDLRRPPAQLREVDLVPALYEVAEGWEEAYRRREIHLDVELPHSLRTVTDGRRVQEVLTALLDNAQKYTPAGGTVRLWARLSGDGIEIGVTDSGRGIPEEDLPHIFERFYRVDKARSRAFGGTGLGLAIASNLATSIGGRLEALSAPGEGSTFTLHLMRSDEGA